MHLNTPLIINIVDLPNYIYGSPLAVCCELFLILIVIHPHDALEETNLFGLLYLILAMLSVRGE